MFDVRIGGRQAICVMDSGRRCEGGAGWWRVQTAAARQELSLFASSCAFLFSPHFAIECMVVYYFWEGVEYE